MYSWDKQAWYLPWACWNNALDPKTSAWSHHYHCYTKKANISEKILRNSSDCRCVNIPRSTLKDTYFTVMRKTDRQMSTIWGSISALRLTSCCLAHTAKPKQSAFLMFLNDHQTELQNCSLSNLAISFSHSLVVQEITSHKADGPAEFVWTALDWVQV